MKTCTIETYVNGEAAVHRIVLTDKLRDQAYESEQSVMVFGQLEHEFDVAKWHYYPRCNVRRYSIFGED